MGGGGGMGQGGLAPGELQILNLGGKCEWSFFVEMVGTNLGKCEWVWEGKLRWLNPRWPNSRWLPSSSWVRMNEFESDWISLSQSQSGVRVFWVNLREDNKVSESKMAVSESKMAAIIKLSQNEWVKFFLCKWWGGKCEWSFFLWNGGNQSWQVWVSLRGKTKIIYWCFSFCLISYRTKDFLINRINF